MTQKISNSQEMNHIFIQARINSERLPKKILKKISNKTILEIIYERAKKIHNIDDIILVTGDEIKNELLIQESRRLGIPFYCGSENNILERFINAGKKYNSANIIRLTGDNPLLDFSIINTASKIFHENNFDILNVNRISTLPYGMNFEIFTFSSLMTARNEILNEISNRKKYFESFFNPVNCILNNSKFNVYDFKLPINYSHIRLTMDYEDDYVLIKKIFKNFSNNNDFVLQDIVSFLNQNPSLLKINEKYSKK